MKVLFVSHPEFATGNGFNIRILLCCTEELRYARYSSMVGNGQPRKPFAHFLIIERGEQLMVFIKFLFLLELLYDGHNDRITLAAL